MQFNELNKFLNNSYSTNLINFTIFSNIMQISQVIYCITSRSITLNIYFTTWDLFKSINNFTYNYLTQFTFKLLCLFLPIVPNPAGFKFFISWLYLFNKI